MFMMWSDVLVERVMKLFVGLNWRPLFQDRRSRPDRQGKVAVGPTMDGPLLLNLRWVLQRARTDSSKLRHLVVRPHSVLCSSMNVTLSAAGSLCKTTFEESHKDIVEHRPQSVRRKGLDDIVERVDPCAACVHCQMLAHTSFAWSH